MSIYGKRKKILFRCISALIAVAAVFPLASCELTDRLFGNQYSKTDVPTDSGSVTDTPVTPGTSDPGADVTTGSPDVPVFTLPGQNTEPDTEPGITTKEPDKVYYTDPLTGLPEEVNYSKVRPVSIVFDNLSSASPQTGIGRADILIECMAEGGISRLIGITNKYSASEVYGPIRSTRDYMVSVSQAFGTLMVGAGYSPTGYSFIKDNSLDYIDGTHDRYALSGFFRDVERYEKTGYEHSLMITGQGIKALATINNFPVTVSKYGNAFNFTSPDKSVTGTGGSSLHIILTYSNFQQVQLIYSKKENSYYRYQYGTKAHLDASTGEQLNFTNVFILFAKQSAIPGDTEGRISVETTGSGTGYYIAGGRYTEIEWSRENDLAPFRFTSGGKEITVNCGKTFITVVNSALKGTASANINYQIN